MAVAVAAMVLALGGTGYAASTVVHPDKASVKIKIKVGPRGPRGARGPKGAKGPAGPAGAAGTNGIAGAVGATGAAGATGPKGTTGATGTNGSTGPAGTTGATGTFGLGVLPSGQTETGVYDVDFTDQTNGGSGSSPISFAMKLATAPTVVFVPKGGSNANCPGTGVAPAAKAGFLCVFETNTQESPIAGVYDVLTDNQNVASVYGASVYVTNSTSSIVGNDVEDEGTWAVTAK